MKRFILTLTFAAFLSAGLVSCSDDAAEVTPNQPELNTLSGNGGGTDNPGAKTKP